MNNIVKINIAIIIVISLAVVSLVIGHFVEFVNLIVTVGAMIGIYGYWKSIIEPYMNDASNTLFEKIVGVIAHTMIILSYSGVILYMWYIGSLIK